MVIRPLDSADVPVLVPAMAALLRSLALEFVVHESTPPGAAAFLAENDEHGIRGYLARGHACHVALDDERLAGFIAIRDNSHVFHLFVGTDWQRQGLARRLWQAARAAAIARGGDGNFTVNASNYAVPAYERLGFVRVAPTQCVKGLSFNPMHLAWEGD
jgi:ribosomal protein S18 acetylase RimI-like enzyme